MELRLDRLLDNLRNSSEDILRAIDQDPLLVKRESGELVLANASQDLFTPTEVHHLYAKGIVYARNPYRLVSLPLIKIYNVGERDVQLDDLAMLSQECSTIRYLRKLDGSLIQAFRQFEKTYFTTRGMIEGCTNVPTSGQNTFDYLGTVRSLARQNVPALLEEPELLEGRTLLFELIHPHARVITDYGDMEGLFLLAAFDHNRFRYLPYDELTELGTKYGLSTVDVLSPKGNGLPEQIDDLLAHLEGTDQEGSVVNFERGDEVVYRVKIKTPLYLRILRAMATCTYEKTVSMLEANPGIGTWAEFESHLKGLGTEAVPEEVLCYYQRFYETHQRYLADCHEVLEWAEAAYRSVRARVMLSEESDPRAFRKAFAAAALKYPMSPLLFAALDERLDLDRVRMLARSPDEAAEAIATIRTQKKN